MLRRECKWSGRSEAITDTNTLCSINTQQQTSKAGTLKMVGLSHAARREVASPLLLRSMGPTGPEWQEQPRTECDGGGSLMAYVPLGEMGISK